MPVPKKRSSSTRTAMRRAHKHLDRTFAVLCPNCSAPVLRHHVCLSCGQYRGKQVMKVKSDSASTAS